MKSLQLVPQTFRSQVFQQMEKLDSWILKNILITKTGMNIISLTVDHPMLMKNFQMAEISTTILRILLAMGIMIPTIFQERVEETESQ